MADKEQPQASTTKPEPAPAPTPALPDYFTNPNAVLGDTSATWRYGKPPDYSNTRKVFAETKSQNHASDSLPALVENLVKNWEIEASFKPNLEDWRTVNASKYTFAINGAPPQTAQHMLNVGTYNAIIAPNEYYDPRVSDFASSHKTFKRMMPTFAWEVLEVYSGPPKCAFRWRHWGRMERDYVGFNNKEEKITAKAHGGAIDIQGVTVADLDEDMKVVRLETWFDPMDMFRQIAPGGIINKHPMNHRTPAELMDEEYTGEAEHKAEPPKLPESTDKPSFDDKAESNEKSGNLSTPPDFQPEIVNTITHPKPDESEKSPIQEKLEDTINLEAGEAVAAPPLSEETQQAHEEMGTVRAGECPFFNAE